MDFLVLRFVHGEFKYACAKPKVNAVQNLTRICRIIVFLPAPSRPVVECGLTQNNPASNPTSV